VCDELPRVLDSTPRCFVLECVRVLDSTPRCFEWPQRAGSTDRAPHFALLSVTSCPILLHARKSKADSLRRRLAYLGLVESGLQDPWPTDRQDIAAALRAVAPTKSLFESRAKIPTNSSKWTGDDGAVMTYHLHKAVALGDVVGMERLVSLGTPVSSPLPPWADTPLHTAARFDQVDALEWLLGRGARVQARTVEGWTPLMMGAAAASDRVVTALLAKGSRPDTRGIPPLSLDALDCCDLAGLKRSNALAQRLETALAATGAAATGAPAAVKHKYTHIHTNTHTQTHTHTHTHTHWWVKPPPSGSLTHDRGSLNSQWGTPVSGPL